MDILLLSQNRVIIEFIKIASKKLKANLNILHSLKELPNRDFDAVIIDEHFSILPCKEIVERIKHKKAILLSSKSNQECDILIKKPFLPNDIVDVLKEQQQILNQDEIDLIKKLLKETDTKVLNGKNKESFSIDIDSFVDAIYSMEPKTLKEILQDAKITLSIEFKGSKWWMDQF